jgi:glycosyltransferase involved in cell wall biosynthesis
MTPTRRMRVALVCEAAGGGVGKHVLDVAERLPSRGFDVLVVHCTRRAEPEFADRLSMHAAYGYRVAQVDVDRAPGPRDMMGVMQLRRAVREFGGADVLHGHSAKGGALARLARWRCARRVFYTPHAFYAQAPSLSATSRRIYGLAEQALSFATDRVIATSHDELGLARRLGIPARKLTVVENGITVRGDGDLTRARIAARAALGIGFDERVVGFVARLVPQKAPVLAVDVLQRVRRTHPRTRFVLVGDGPEAPLVEDALRSARLADNVTWLRRAVGGEVLPAFDVLLVTSHYEGFPYVMLEALDAGCAIVSTAVGGARDCVAPGRNGAIVAPATADALASAIAPFLESADRRRVAHEVSRDRAREFEIGRMVDRLVTLYRDAAHAA